MHNLIMCREFYLKASTVEMPEEHFNADEYMDSAMVIQPTIYISVKEIVATHSVRKYNCTTNSRKQL